MNSQPPRYNIRTTTLRGEMPYGMNYYEQAVIQHKIMLRQREEEYLKKKLKEDYPVKFIIGHSIAVTVVCVTLIALQIAMFVNQSPVYFVASGFWVSAYLLIPMTLVLCVSK